jgi:ABC-type lipopolysaccharide export system ATPase subunit
MPNCKPLNLFYLIEPFAGVDPVAVEDIRELATQLKDKNIEVFS